MNTRAMAFFIVLAATLSLVSSAKADSVSVTLTGVSGGIQGNVYTSPYYATVGNTANVPIVCDDYSHEVYMGESWTAAVSTFADLSNTRFWQGTEAATLQLYGAAAYLFNETLLTACQPEWGHLFRVMGCIRSEPSRKLGWLGQQRGVVA